MNNKIKVSIIIPAYNMEKYIERCIASCLKQTLREIEIIVVDDASKDGTATLLANLARSYDNVRVFLQKENKRQGAARNVGIQNCRGEYLLFLDADDWIEETACEALYNAAQGADMCGGDMFIDTEQEQSISKIHYPSLHKCSPKEREAYLKNCGMFWSRIYRRAFLQAYNIRFPEDIFYEDLAFNTLCGLYFESLVKTDVAFYHYYQRADSTVHLQTEERYDRIAVANQLYTECVARGLREKYAGVVDWKYLHTMGGNVLYMCLPTENLSRLCEIKRSVKQNMPYYRKGLKKVEPSLRFALRAVLFSPRFAVWTYKKKLLSYWEVLYNKFNTEK